jgi:hypothetical protein
LEDCCIGVPGVLGTNEIIIGDEGDAMDRLTTDQVREACRIFLSLAYAGGAGGVPESKRFLLALPSGASALEFLGTQESAKSCCQVTSGKADGKKALLIRLGCSHYPHLKLKAQGCPPPDPTEGRIGDDGSPEHVFSVDTHDAFSSSQFFPPPGQAEAESWREIQGKNAALKQVIEAAWEEAGIQTFNAILRRGLATADQPR